MGCEQSIWSNGAISSPMMRLVCSSDTTIQYVSGDTIQNRVSIINDSTLTMTNVTVSTNKSATTLGPFTIDAGANRTINIDQDVTTADESAGQASCVVMVSGTVDGQPVNEQCTITTPVAMPTGNHSLRIVSVSFDPPDPQSGDTVTITVVGENDGDVDIDDFTIDVTHPEPPNLNPRIVCPMGVMTDPTTFTMMWRQEQFPVGINQVNLDGRVTLEDGSVFDPGDSFVVTSPQPGIYTATYDLTLKQGWPASAQGIGTFQMLYWYNGNFAENYATVDGQPGVTDCQFEYNF